MSRLEKNNTESGNKMIRSYESTREKVSKNSKCNRVSAMTRKQITRSVPIGQDEISEDEDLNLLASMHISGTSSSSTRELGRVGFTDVLSGSEEKNCNQECSHDQTINENGILTYTAGYVETELRTTRTTNPPKQGGRRKRTHKRK